jgi:membrane protease YdiL (CAAX protease family)
MEEDTSEPDPDSPALVEVTAAVPTPPKPVAEPPSFWQRHPKLQAIGRALLFLFGYIALELVLGLMFRPLVEALAFFVPLEGDRLLLSRVATLPFVLGYALFFSRWIDRRPPAALGLGWPSATASGRRPILRSALRSSFATLAFLALWLGGAEIEGHFSILGWSPAVAPGGFEAHDLGALALLLGGFLIQGGIEELILRGGFYGSLRRAISPAAAAIVSSGLFALAHAGNPGFTAASCANTFLAGVLLCALFERTGSLWAPTWVHGVWNFAIGGLLSLPVSGIEIFRLFNARLTGPAAWTGGTYGPEGSWVLVPMLTIAIVLISRRKKTKGEPEPDPPLVDSNSYADLMSVSFVLGARLAVAAVGSVLTARVVGAGGLLAGLRVGIPMLAAAGMIRARLVADLGFLSRVVITALGAAAGFGIVALRLFMHLAVGRGLFVHLLDAAVLMAVILLRMER